MARTGGCDRHEGTVAFSHTMVERGFEGPGLDSVLARCAPDAIWAETARTLRFCPFTRDHIQ